ncbi:MAG: hypothetical protein OSB28_02260, partial [Flavobacteriales bacterium]|nr:hypothetical protein [Flavobacteriales bacterium]
ITLVIILGMFLNTCGQMTYEDEGMGSKSIGEAGTTTDDTTTDDTTTTDTTGPNYFLPDISTILAKSGSLVKSREGVEPDHK